MKSTMKEPKKTFTQFHDINQIHFSAFSANQIENYSVLEIEEHQFYQNQLPMKRGLFDLRLGVTGNDEKCQTCGQSTQCPGHFGHVKLSEPILHYGFLNTVVKILQCICHRCCRLKRFADKQQRNKMMLIKRHHDPQKKLGLMSKLLRGLTKCNKQSQQEDLFDKNYKPCGGWISNKISINNYRVHYIDQNGRNCIFTRRQIFRLLEGFSAYEAQCEAIGFTKTKPIDLMIESVAIPPPQVRPFVLINNNQKKIQDDLSVAYSKVVRINNQIKHCKLGLSEKTALVDELEKTIGAVMIKLRKPNNKQGKQVRKIKNIKSISERLKGKEGRFRQNLLGKRVDFAARTVISPDPSLDIGQVGIPDKIAKNLTYPQKITQFNYERILDSILQKKVKYLICLPETSLRNEQKFINVSKIQASTREQLEPYVNFGMVAERVLENGDYVLLNRQPTLHRMSMMAHKVKILPFNTFRINLSVCMPYNADFDGDEMNLHIPQSLQSVSELKNIASVQKQIVGPKNGSTSLGFSQDSLLGAFLLTSRDTFITKQQFMNLLMRISGDHDFIQQAISCLPMPTIIKPEPLWTGKQVVSTILPKDIQIRSLKTKSKQHMFSNEHELNVIIRNGQLVTGALQKENIGASSNLHNIIHWIWTEKNDQMAGNFINSLQKMIYSWLNGVGFSIGASDIVPDASVIKRKQQEKKTIQTVYYNLLNQFRNAKQIKKLHYHQQGKKIEDSFQYVINLKLNNELSKIQQFIKNSEKSQKNQIYKIIEAKSKGSETNLAQIIYSVGNQNINGMRCPLGFSRRSLPHFCRDDNSPFARGYIVNSFYNGLNPSQFFFHSMAGREGLSDTAIKTSHVGYLQRKIVKSLEDIIVKYDGSVRDASNNVLQNYYGEDGFSGEYIEKHRCFAAEFTKKKFREVYKWKQEELKKFFKYSNEDMSKLKRQYSLLYRNRKIFNEIFSRKGQQGVNYQYYCPITVQRIINKVKLSCSNITKAQDLIHPRQIYETVQLLIRDCVLPPEKYLQQIKKTTEMNKKVQNNKEKQEYQSFSDQFEREDEDEIKLVQKNYNGGEKTEVKYQSLFQIFKMHLRFSLSSKILLKYHKLSKSAFALVIKQIKQKFCKSLATAGEAVGCLASQSIGEPTTQMTLNTFHLAGVSDRNVTLGLPRLQQILSCSKSCQNTLLTIYPRKPILEQESSKHQNQSYLLDLLICRFPELKIGHFIQSSHFSFNPNDLALKSDGLNTLNNGKRTAWTVTMFFYSQKINSNKIWQQIIDKISKKESDNYEIDEIDDFDELSQKQNNPKIVLRLIHTPNSGVQQHQKNVKLLQQIQIAIKQTPILGIKGLNSVRLSSRSLNIDKQHKNKQYIVFEASGQCLKECLSHKQVNSIRTISNNIQQVFETLGIEAARQALIKEFKQVLKPYGITINYRHLSILADWMCMQGVLTPVNRNGINQLKSLSTLTKASFEKVNDVLFKAAVFSTKDEIKNASERIIFGQSTDCGTSQCQLMLDPQKCGKFQIKPQKSHKNIQQQLNMVQLMKTPEYQDDITIDNSLYDGRKSLNFSAMNSQYSYIGRSPGLGTSPILSFSPSYSPAYQPMKSPNYSQNTHKYDTYQTTLKSKLASPSYQTSIKSPSYNMLASNRYPSASSMIPKVNQFDKKQEEADENEDTQRTEGHLMKNGEDEDQF